MTLITRAYDPENRSLLPIPAGGTAIGGTQYDNNALTIHIMCNPAYLQTHLPYIVFDVPDESGTMYRQFNLFSTPPVIAVQGGFRFTVPNSVLKAVDGNRLRFQLAFVGVDKADSYEDPSIAFSNIEEYSVSSVDALLVRKGLTNDMTEAVIEGTSAADWFSANAYVDVEHGTADRRTLIFSTRTGRRDVRQLDLQPKNTYTETVLVMDPEGNYAEPDWQERVRTFEDRRFDAGDVWIEHFTGDEGDASAEQESNRQFATVKALRSSQEMADILVKAEAAERRKAVAELDAGIGDRLKSLGDAVEGERGARDEAIARSEESVRTELRNYIDGRLTGIYRVKGSVAGDMLTGMALDGPVDPVPGGGYSYRERAVGTVYNVQGEQRALVYRGSGMWDDAVPGAYPSVPEYSYEDRSDGSWVMGIRGIRADVGDVYNLSSRTVLFGNGVPKVAEPDSNAVFTDSGWDLLHNTDLTSYYTRADVDSKLGERDRAIAAVDGRVDASDIRIGDLEGQVPRLDGRIDGKQDSNIYLPTTSVPLPEAERGTVAYTEMTEADDVQEIGDLAAVLETVVEGTIGSRITEEERARISGDEALGRKVLDVGDALAALDGSLRSSMEALSTGTETALRELRGEMAAKVPVSAMESYVAGHVATFVDRKVASAMEVHTETADMRYSRLTHDIGALTDESRDGDTALRTDLERMDDRMYEVDTEHELRISVLEADTADTVPVYRSETRPPYARPGAVWLETWDGNPYE